MDRSGRIFSRLVFTSIASMSGCAIANAAEAVPAVPSAPHAANERVDAMAVQTTGEGKENGSASGIAPASDNRGLDEIVVTARKRAESLINVPVAVSVLDKTDIQRYSADDLSKIARLAPQVIVANGQNGGGASFVIRGLGSSSGDAGLEQSVSVNIDGVQVGRGRILALGQFDLQGVEVLKGPQALYFGRNSPAGVISLTSAGPTDALGGYIKASYETVARERILEGALSGPITDNLKARLALRGRKMSGWLINEATAGPNPIDPRYPVSDVPFGRLPRASEVAGRLTVDYTPSSDTDVTLKVLAGRTNDLTSSIGGQLICFAPSTAITTRGFVNPGTDTDCKLDKYTQYAYTPPQNLPLTNWPGMRKDGSPFAITKTMLTSLTVNQKIGDNLDLTSVTGYFELRFRQAGQATLASLPVTLTTAGEHTTTFSQELRLNSSYDGPLNFTLGGFYSDMDLSTYNRTAYLFQPTNPDPATGNVYAFDRRASTKGKVLSGFGQLRWSILEDLELAGGVRYTHEKKDGMTGNLYVNPVFAAGFFPQGVFIQNRRRENNWSPEVTLTWHPVRGQTLYAAYKTGYKAGGLSQPTPVPANATLEFNAERIKGGEIGYKAELFDRKVRADIVAYTYKVTDLQTIAFDGTRGISFLTNAGLARTRGVEFSALWQATERLRLRSQIGYNQARYLRFTNSPCFLLQTAAEGCVKGQQDLTGRPLARAPELVVTAGASYTRPLGDDLELGLDLDLYHTSSYFRQENLQPFSKQKSYQLLNAAIRLGQPQSGWQLSVQGRNLTNKYYADVTVDQAFGGRNQFTAYGARPRQIVLEASYRF